jgi:hypothetical protein
MSAAMNTEVPASIEQTSQFIKGSGRHSAITSQQSALSSQQSANNAQENQ